MFENSIHVMFTGIITHIGKIRAISKHSLKIFVPKSFATKATIGISVSVDGICLTVSKKISSRRLSFDIMEETLTKTNLCKRRKDDAVNLELPATPKNFLSGHIVQGHIDGMGSVSQQVRKSASQEVLTIEVPKKIHKFLVDKGSVAVNGVSLTIIKTSKHVFTVGIIPYTNQHTNFQYLKKGDAVNIEVDIIGKYIYKYAKKI